MKKTDNLDIELDMRLHAAHRGRIPENVQTAVNEALFSLPENPPAKIGTRLRGRRSKILCSAAAVAAVIAIFVALPNLSPSIASALDDVPLLGTVVRAVTFRTYSASKEGYQAAAEVPLLEGDAGGADSINDDIKSMTDSLIAQFEAESGSGRGHQSLNISYEVVTDTDEWFTLKLIICEAAGSSNEYYKYYHIDKKTGNSCRLSDIFSDNSYIDIISDEIKRQMREQMSADSSVCYWIDSDTPQWDFSRISADQNFYFDADGNTVIAFDKYDVSPGYMGCPEFVIPHSLTDGLE